MITLGVITLVFSEALALAQGKAQGWSYYLTTPEVLFEVWVRLVGAALAGAALGSAVTLLLVFLLWLFPSRRERIAEVAIGVTVALIVFFVSRYALQLLIQWSYQWSHHSAIYDKLLLWAQFLIFVVALAVPRGKKELVSSLDGFLTEKMTRRTAIATVAGTAALVVTEFTLGKRLPIRERVGKKEGPRSNFLVITFDALCAEDMSFYGCKLATTPHIDAFARKSTVFTKFYSASTFTTPAVATILTGLYPSEDMVYHLQGSLRSVDAQRSLPHLLRDAGYTTGAFVTNPYAYYLAKTAANEFDELPEPNFPTGGMQGFWHATTPLHQDSGFGSRVDEYKDMEAVWAALARVPINRSIRYRPTAVFEEARRILANLPDGFFLWLHVVSPHRPYIPDAPDRNRFLPEAELRSFDEEVGERWQPHYPPSAQKQVDLRRMAYDEFVATADRAFGAFMEDLERSGKLQDTTVIVSADHGESFEGGVFEHRTAYLTRPVIHVPLVVRTPGQQEGRRIQVTGDQTSLPPTILELAGLPIPTSMRGPSLARWLKSEGDGEGEGLAFTQYLDRNSVFKPLTRGSVGAIDSEYEYVVYLDTKKGELRPLDRAEVWNLNRSTDNPARADSLRAAIRNRFPDLLG
jgi:arylsulfatase A-like enzyme